MSSDKPSAVRSHRHYLMLAVAAIMVATALVYAPRLHDFFLSDDFHYLRACHESPYFGADDQWYAVTVGQMNFHFRPVFGLSGWLIYQIGGLDPFWWHLASLMLHLLSVWLTIMLVRRFVDSDWAAVAAGAVFALHFINAETVVWISARTSLLVTALVLGTVVIETLPRKRLWGAQRWIGLSLAVLAHLSKEHAVALPVLLLLIPKTPVPLDGPPQLMVSGRWRRFWEQCFQRVRHFWPYVILTAMFIIVRFGAIAASTEALFYRIELHANVIKNFVFLCVASLYPLDFRAALSAWNGWYLQGDWGALANFVLGYPGVIVGSIVALGIWSAIFLWGHRAAKRLAAWVFIAALPVLFFRGTGERLIYISLPGMAGAVAIVLAVWHRAFVSAFARIGRWISPVLVLILLSINVYWLDIKLRDWESASDLVQTIVGKLRTVAQAMPADATVRFTGLPDNINGAWVFRLGIDDAFTLYANRPDVHAIPTHNFTSEPPDSTALDYEWTGDGFVLTTDAAPDARTAPQSTEP